MNSPENANENSSDTKFLRTNHDLEPKYRLVVRSGPNPGHEHYLEPGEILIGRDISSHIILNHAEMSRYHARITAIGDDFAIEDQNSTNGTFVNHQRVTGMLKLNPGDLIGFGTNIALQFLAPGQSPAEVAIPLATAGVDRGYTPASPEEVVVEEKKPTSPWLILMLGILVILIIVLAGGAFVFDYLNLYCTPAFKSFFPACL